MASVMRCLLGYKDGPQWPAHEEHWALASQWRHIRPSDVPSSERPCRHCIVLYTAFRTWANQ